MTDDSHEMRDLFFAQVAAFKQRDGGTVQTLAQMARDWLAGRQESLKTITWDEAKQRIDRMQEPNADNIVGSAKVLNSGTHKSGKSKEPHGLLSHSWSFHVAQFPAFYSWSVCPQCQSTRWKRMIVFNREGNSCYIRKF